MDMYLFLSTVNNIEEGKKIGRVLVEEKLAACVNIVQNLCSIYEWKGKIEEENEHLLLIKTTGEKRHELIKKIMEIHSYEEPEVIGLRIEDGSESYLKWIKQVLK